MNANKPGENLTRGFIKRIWNYTTANLYKKKLNRNQYFDKNWENTKWKLRFGRLLYFVSVYYLSKYILVDSVYNRNKQFLENKRNLFINNLQNLNFVNDLFNINNNENKNFEEKKLIQKINELNEGMFTIENITIADIIKSEKDIDFDLNSKSEITNGRKKDLNNFKNFTNEEKCNLLINLYYNITNKNNNEILKQNNLDINKENLLFYKVNNVLTQSQMKEETEESQNFIG